MAEKMDMYFSVFNNHVNDADKRARAVLADHAPAYLKRVEELEAEGNGIMYIFQVPQEPETVAYALLVTAFVNG